MITDVYPGRYPGGAYRRWRGCAQEADVPCAPILAPGADRDLLERLRSRLGALEETPAYLRSRAGSTRAPRLWQPGRGAQPCNVVFIGCVTAERRASARRTIAERLSDRWDSPDLSSDGRGVVWRGSDPAPLRWRARGPSDACLARVRRDPAGLGREGPRVLPEDLAATARALLRRRPGAFPGGRPARSARCRI